MQHEPSTSPLPTDPRSVAPSLTAQPDWKVLAVLCLSTFFVALSFFAPTPFYPQIARDLQTTAPLLGQVVTLMALISAALGLLVGPLADRYGFRWPLVVGLLAIAAGLIGFGLAPSYGVLLALGVMSGLGDALVYALPFAIVATRFTGAAQRRAIGWTIGALSMAPIIGVPLLTALGEASGWRIALGVAGVAAILVAAVVVAVLPADGRRPATPLRLPEILAAYTPLLRHASSLRLLAISGLRGMWWVGMLTYLGAFLGTAVGLSEARIGPIYALVGGAYALGSIAAGGRLSTRPPRQTLIASSVVAGIAAGPIFLLTSIWAILPLLLAGSLASAILSVTVVAILAVESPAGAGTTMVLNGSVLNLGTAAGAVIGGALIAIGGFGAIGIGLPIFALLTAALAWWPGQHATGS